MGRVKSLLPPDETLKSERHRDGRYHVVYPTALLTLCGRVREPQHPRGGRPGVPTCGRCSRTARLFDRVDSSMPDSWRFAA